MIKRATALFVALFIAALLSFCTLAAAGGEMYDDFDEYYEYEDEAPGRVQHTPARAPWYSRLSIVPVAIGVAAGAVYVVILYKKTPDSSVYPSAVRESTVTHEVTAEREIKTENTY